MSGLINSVARVFYENRNYRFWAYQCGGWTGFALVTFVSITVFDNNVSLPHITHIAMQAVLGIASSWPLRPLYRSTLHAPVLVRLITSAVAIAVLSFFWTAGRIYATELITGETHLWDELNYWYFGSLFVFLSWTVLYLSLIHI